MKWHLILLGIIEDPYSRNFWILPVLSIVGSLLCVYRYKLGWIVIPIVSIVAVVFLAGFLEPENYRQITGLSDSMPRTLLAIAVFFALPFLGTYLSWLRLTRKAVAPS